MSVYESISRSSTRIKRRLFDEAVRTSGREMKIVRIQYKEDIWHDLSNIEQLSTDVIHGILRFPDEIPLERFRSDGQSEVEETKVFFFDLLPIELYTRIDDHVENKDLIFFTLDDESENSIPFLLQVTETFGKFETGLVWKKSYLAPQHGALTAGIYDQLKEYYEESDDADPLLREDETSEDPELVREKRLSKIMGEN